MRGRIHADAVFVNQSEQNQAIYGDFQNAVGFRRARLGAEGQIGGQIQWVSEFDFAGGEIAFKDVWIGLAELPWVRRLRVGHMREPFSLEFQTSSNDITFIERSTIAALDPVRNWGLGFFSYSDDERATLAGGAFRSGTSNFGEDMGDGNDMSYTGRLTCLPFYQDDARLMHLGAAFSQVYPKNDVVTFDQGPQSSLLVPSTDNPLSPVVPNIAISASQEQLYNLEWSWVLGPLSLQAEWSAANVDQIGGGPVFLHGFYFYASYFLTGEHRQYVPRDGTFGTTRVLAPFVHASGQHNVGCGPGAWELTARIDYFDLSSPNIPPANGLAVGNRVTEATFGINWYLSDNARIMFNYLHAVPVDPNFGPSAADAFFLRTAIFW
jgi:phosphate-selective porin OprO/OprP